jgi:sugar phosphate isomerase/epimerase
VAAAAYAGNTAFGAPDVKPKVKLGVTLYSYNGDLQTGTMTMEDCLVDMEDMGAEGVEFLPDALVPDYPNPGERWVQQWFGWLEKYRLKPSALDSSPDTKLYHDRGLSAQEIADQIIRDLALANRLGFKVYRGLGSSWPSALGPKGSVWANVSHLEVYDKVLPYAEKYDVKIAEELHIPFLFKSDWMDQTMNYIQKTRTRHLGFNVDMSIFLRRPIPTFKPEDFAGRGTPKAVIDYVVKAREDGVLEERAREEVRKLGGGQTGEMLTAMTYHLTYRTAEQNDPKELVHLMPYIFHCHAKFYLVPEDLSDEHSIPYREIIPILARAGYNNYLSSEYEGDRGPFVASHQIRRQHLMIRRMWDEA